MPIGAFITGAISTVGGLLKNRKSDGGGLFKGLFGGREARIAKRAERKAQKVAAKADKTIERVVEGATGLDKSQTKIDDMFIWFKDNWFIPAGAAGLAILLWIVSLLSKKKVGGRPKGRRKNTSTNKSSTGKKRPQTVITTKGGKVIRGADNVKAYKKKLANLKKAQKARK